MKTFDYRIVADVASAIVQASQHPGTQYIAGGTSQVDLLKENVQQPELLIDLSGLPLNGIELLPNGWLRIKANVKNAVAARHPLIQNGYPAISEALLAGASQQIRNMASMAGNLLQRTRCPYLRDSGQPCNKRSPGTGCAAINGNNRMSAIFGATDDGPQSEKSCIATHPSDMAVALAVHEAIIVIENINGQKRIDFSDLHRLPGNLPHLDTNLAHGDMIIAIELPPSNGCSHYLKVRDRASFAFALVSCAIAMTIDNGFISNIRIALGGVAHKPWRLTEVEGFLKGNKISLDLFDEAAVIAAKGAKTYNMNEYKPLLLKALVKRGLLETSGMEPLQGPAGTAFASSVGGIAGINL